MQMNVQTTKSQATISLATYAGSNAQQRAIKVLANLAEAKDAISLLTQSPNFLIHACHGCTQCYLPQQVLSPL